MKKIIGRMAAIGFVAIFLPFFISQVYAVNLSAAKAIKPDQTSPPWLDLAWNYRTPVVVTNNGAGLAWYQVLIKLEETNFNFNHTKSDGSDVRVTYSDGTTELSYWIETWDKVNHQAYIWVRVPNIATGNNTIFLYYGNPAASSASNGNTTFDSFDDNWSQFGGVGLNQEEELQNLTPNVGTYNPFAWITISGTPSVSNGILSLANGVGIKSTSIYQYNAMGMRAKFNSGNGDKWGGFIDADSGQQMMVGDLPSDASNLYLIYLRVGSEIEAALLPRVGGKDWHNTYHIYEVRWSALQSIGDIDHGISTAPAGIPGQVPNISLPVTLYSHNGAGASLLVDWVYVRQYRVPEPHSEVGVEQGLVALSIESIASPDPVQLGRRLTYQLTVSNTSNIDAPGVVVTDTLPASVQIDSIDSTQGSCEPGSIVLCYMDSLTATTTAWITINVNVTIDGVLTNLAAIGSPGYELDLRDNTQTEETLVAIPPVVNWEGPVQNGGTYISRGGLVTLAATATDNDQVAWVEFKYWDHVGNQWVIIGRDYTYPYQVQFDTSILAPNESYQTFAYAADRAGNQSDPYNPLQRILIIRRSTMYFPVIQR